MRISAVWYPVRQWEESKEFYKDVLRLHETHCNDENGWVAYRTSQGPPVFIVRQSDPSVRPGGAVLTFECTDLDSLRKRLQQAGAKIEDHEQAGPGIRVLAFYDPDGNRLEATQPVDLR